MVSLMPFINKPDSSIDLTIYIISFISSLEIINVVKPYPNIFLQIAASVVDAATVNVNPNRVRIVLVNGLSTFPIKDNPVLSYGPKSLPKNPPDGAILCNSVFDSFISAEELFAKALQSFETCVLVNDNFI